jgi:hypothetical protein
VIAIFTGPKLTVDAVESLTEAAEQGAWAHAIVAEKADAPPAITVHIASVPGDQLVPDLTAITWFANGEGQVVAFLRPASGTGFAKAIVVELSAARNE